MLWLTSVRWLLKRVPSPGKAMGGGAMTSLTAVYAGYPRGVVIAFTGGNLQTQRRAPIAARGTTFARLLHQLSSLHLHPETSPYANVSPSAPYLFLGHNTLGAIPASYAHWGVRTDGK